MEPKQSKAEAEAETTEEGWRGLRGSIVAVHLVGS